MIGRPDIIVAAARSFAGVPWRHCGRSRSGVDCIGLVLLALREAEIEIPDPAPYEREPQGPRLLEGILAHADQVARHQAGDVLLFRMGVYGAHVGIASMHATWRVQAVIHAYAPHRMVVEAPIDNEMRRALVGAFRLRGG